MDASELAHKIYEDFAFEKPSDVELKLVAYNNNLIIELVDLGDIDGLIIATKYGGIIKINEKIKDEGWYRFTLAHELGHFLYKLNLGLLGESYDISYYLHNDSRQEEIFVNEFAAELLMPEIYFSDFIKNQEPNIDLFIRISKEFKVSIPAAAVRYSQLGHMPIVVTLCKNNVIKWSFANKKFPLKFIKTNSLVPYGSETKRLINMNGIRGKNKVKPDVWFYNDYNLKKHKNLTLIEECIRLSDEVSILTVIKQI